MELDRALAQISDIHAHLDRAEVYRGYRALPVSLTAGAALLAAWGQTSALGAPAPPAAFLAYWILVAGVALATAGGFIGYRYFFRETEAERRKTLRVVGQFLPCLAGGALATFLFAPLGEEAIRLLPGLWALLFSLGIFASRPYLPRAIGWAGLFYLLAGARLLFLAPTPAAFSPWGIGSIFGIGQLLSAFVLYWNLERVDDAA